VREVKAVELEVKMWKKEI